MRVEAPRLAGDDQPGRASTVGSAARRPSSSCSTSSSAASERSPGTVRRSTRARAARASTKGESPPEATVTISEAPWSAELRVARLDGVEEPAEVGDGVDALVGLRASGRPDR